MVGFEPDRRPELGYRLGQFRLSLQIVAALVVDLGPLVLNPEPGTWRTGAALTVIQEEEPLVKGFGNKLALDRDPGTSQIVRISEVRV